MGVGAIDAFKRAAPFGLKVQNSAVFQVVTQVGTVFLKISAELFIPRGRNWVAVFRGNDARNQGGIFLVFQSIQEEDQTFALSNNAIIGIQRIHGLVREDGQSAAPQHNQCPGIVSDDLNEFTVDSDKTFWIATVGIVDVPERNTDHIRSKLPDDFQQRLVTFKGIHIGNLNLMITGNGCGYVIQPQRVNRVRLGEGI